MGTDAVTEAYGARAEEYREAVGRIEHAAPEDRDHVLAWAREVDGPVLDVGCGPGQWTNLLHENGVDVVGVDPTPAFVADAQARYPAARYRIGRAEDLGVPDRSLGGVLAWYSLIHTHPDHLTAPLAELVRCLRPGGSALLGFFLGPDGQAFDHAITTAYSWSVDGLAQRLDDAGLAVVDARTRTEPDARPQGVLVAERPITASPAPAPRG